jgi:hypothetical protein
MHARGEHNIEFLNVNPGVGYAVTQLVDVLRYKPEGRGLDCRWGRFGFFFTVLIRPHCGPRIDSGFNRKEHQGYLLGAKGGRCVGLTT